MNKKIIGLGILILFSGTFLYAQDTIPVSKSQVLQKVIEGNLQIKIAEKNAQAAKADYKQAQSLFLPNINTSYSGISTTNPLMAFGSKLNQEILTMADFNPDLLNNPAKTQNFSTVIEIQQPLINIDGYYGRKAAKAKYEAYQLQTERTKEYLQLEVTKAYMQLQLAYNAVTVLQKAENTAKTNLKLIENYFKNGMVQKTDILNVQVRVNDVTNQLQYAKSNVKNASDYLMFLLNEDMNGKIYKPAELFDTTFSNHTFLEFSKSRKDFLSLEKSNEAYQNMIQSNKFSLLPRLNAFGNYQLFDSKFLGTAAKGYLVGAQLSWNLFDGLKTYGKIDKAKAESQKAVLEAEQYKKQSELEFNKTNRQLLDAQNKVSLAQLALQQSQEAYRIRQNRFSQGLEKTTDLLQSETLQYQKELEYQQALFEYNFLSQYLQFLSN